MSKAGQVFFITVHRFNGSDLMLKNSFVTILRRRNQLKNTGTAKKSKDKTS